MTEKLQCDVKPANIRSLAASSMCISILNEDSATSLKDLKKIFIKGHCKFCNIAVTNREAANPVCNGISIAGAVLKATFNDHRAIETFNDSCTIYEELVNEY